jgi:hypothetical protein
MRMTSKHRTPCLLFAEQTLGTNSEKRTKNHIFKWVRKFNRNKNDSNSDKSTVQAQDNLKEGKMDLI